MGNLSKGVRSESAKVGARWLVRKSLAEAQSLMPRPALSSGSCKFGMANAPSARTGVSFNNSRRVTVANLRVSVRRLMDAILSECDAGPNVIHKRLKGYART